MENREMPYYLKLIVQIRQAVELKEIKDPIDYTTDLLILDAEASSFEDWEKNLDDLKYHLDNAIIEIRSKIDKDWVFFDEEELDLISKNLYDPYEPMTDTFDHYYYRRPDRLCVRIENSIDFDRAKMNLPYFKKLEWLQLKNDQILSVIDYYKKNKEVKPFRSRAEFPSIPFFGNQSSFIALMNLMVNSGFFSIKRKLDKNKLEDKGLTEKQIREFENYYSIFSKDFALMLCDYFHSVDIVKNQDNSGLNPMSIKKNKFWYDTVKGKIGGTNINDTDIKILLELEGQFEKILEVLRKHKKQKISSSQAR